ncbi:MAG: DUF4403 family protein [Bacteroidota bacterium]
MLPNKIATKKCSKIPVNYYLLCFLALSLFSCKAITPVSPPVIVGEYIPPVQKISIMSIPVEMEMKSYFKAADEAVPYEFKGKEQNCDDVSYDYKFNRNPIKIEGKVGKNSAIEIGIDIEGKYALNLNYCAKCTGMFTATETCITPRIYASCGVGEPMRRIKVEYTTQVDLKNNFKLESKTVLKDVIPKDKCAITVFKYDATSQLVKEVKGALKDLSKEIDKEIESLEIKKEVESIWKTFNTPIAIENYGFLYLKPEKIGLDDLRMKGTKLNFTVQLEAFPRVSLVKEHDLNSKLPDLEKIKGEDGFNINLDLIADYDSLSSIVNRELNGKVIEIKKNKIILQKAKIYGASNKQLSIEVEFIGSKTGKMFFLGTPTFNDSLQEISFPDLSFELETKNALLRSAKWLFNDKITHKIRSLTKFNATNLLGESKTKIEEQLNKKIDENIYLIGKMKEVRVKSIYPDNNNLIIQANLKGKLSVNIK